AVEEFPAALATGPRGLRRFGRQRGQFQRALTDWARVHALRIPAPWEDCNGPSHAVFELAWTEPCPLATVARLCRGWAALQPRGADARSIPDCRASVGLIGLLHPGEDHRHSAGPDWAAGRDAGYPDPAGAGHAGGGPAGGDARPQDRRR